VPHCIADSDTAGSSWPVIGNFVYVNFFVLDFLHFLTLWPRDIWRTCELDIAAVISTYTYYKNLANRVRYNTISASAPAPPVRNKWSLNYSVWIVEYWIRPVRRFSAILERRDADNLLNQCRRYSSGGLWAYQSTSSRMPTFRRRQQPDRRHPSSCRRRRVRD